MHNIIFDEFVVCNHRQASGGAFGFQLKYFRLYRDCFPLDGSEGTVDVDDVEDSRCNWVFNPGYCVLDFLV